MKALVLLWSFMICLSCTNGTSKSNLFAQQKTGSIFNIYSLDTLKYLIGNDLNNVKKFHYPNNINLKDTTFESEDELTWKGIVFYKEGKILLFVESNLENDTIIKRITVLSSTIVGLNGLKTGAKFKDIKQNLSQTIPSYPDGYFGLKDKNDKQITYFFDIGNNSDLSIGNVKFETIPKDLVITEILIE